jgi:hypothetical protein
VSRSRSASLKPGEKVLATNTKTGRTSAEPVAAVLLHHDIDRHNLKVKTASGTAVIHTTSKHLFCDLTRHRWVWASRLRHGDLQVPITLSLPLTWCLLLGQARAPRCRRL